ncbi:unnamed protein product [Ilex paraguariensis]|uniref:Dynamin-related protein 3A n=1 Tax=Ilex paraguariensis TaxID=185542 RepID=A0ABC8UDE3_9AQUA
MKCLQFAVCQLICYRPFLLVPVATSHHLFISPSLMRTILNSWQRLGAFNDAISLMPMDTSIWAETNREAGGNKGVSDKQIRLKIFSPNVLDITLVDLPGITKVPVGDQPSDIEARIRTMIMSYIKLPSCLILAVTPANSDLANSDALQIAGNADPDGYRTIGVITKLDIMDRGTDARNFLLGKVIPLRLGYVGVVNRSQEDIANNRTIRDALVAEENFFRSRPVYNDLADRCGVPQLAKKLNQILVQHIMSVLPGLRSRLSAALVSVAKEHASFGEITESKAGQGALLLNILSKYSEAFSSMIEGKNEEMSTSELSGGARIHYIFQSIFVKSLEENDFLIDVVCPIVEVIFITSQVCDLLPKFFAAVWFCLSGANELSANELSAFPWAYDCYNIDVDPCEGLTDDDIRTAIQNATGPKSALFVPEVGLTELDFSLLLGHTVPFEVLVRRQIARLLDPSLQCARFIYDELIKMSHHCMVNEMQRFPVLRRRMDEVIGNFLREGLQPSETMIGHIIEMENLNSSRFGWLSTVPLGSYVQFSSLPRHFVTPVFMDDDDGAFLYVTYFRFVFNLVPFPFLGNKMDYINTSHTNFIGGSKALEMSLQQVKSFRVAAPIPRQKDSLDPEKAPTSERSLRSRAFLARPVNGIVPEQGVRPVADIEKTTSSGTTTGSSWGISSIFGGSDNRISAKENPTSKLFSEPVQSMEHTLSMIHLREPPSVLRPSETHSDQEAIEIAVTKLLLRSYYDIVRKNIEDSVPKAIMHFLVNHTKRELHNVFIKKLYRDNLLEEMLQEPDEVAMKRKRTRETLRVLQQAFRTLDEFPLEAETVERGYSLSTDPTGLPKIHGLPTSSLYPTSTGSTESYTASPNNAKARKSTHSGELQSPFYANADSNGGGLNSTFGLYPTVDM